MSAIASAIPNVFGGFAPFPNTIATALLAYQSEAIGYGFGLKFQYAKRQIGAMSNETFNALDLTELGNLIHSHNDELLQRMADNMPDWLDIQENFIEASVQVEVLKANRTPSAWAEIITAFTGAAGQQIVASIDGLIPEAKSTVLSTSPMLALIYFLSQGSPETQPIPANTIIWRKFRWIGGTGNYYVRESRGELLWNGTQEEIINLYQEGRQYTKNRQTPSYPVGNVFGSSATANQYALWWTHYFKHRAIADLYPNLQDNGNEVTIATQPEPPDLT